MLQKPVKDEKSVFFERVASARFRPIGEHLSELIDEHDLVKIVDYLTPPQGSATRLSKLMLLGRSKILGVMNAYAFLKKYLT